MKTRRTLARTFAVLALTQLVAACGAETAAPEDDRWTLRAEVVEAGAQGDAVRQCPEDGEMCQPLSVGTELSTPVRIETERQGGVSLRWGGADAADATLDVGPAAQLVMADDAGPVVMPAVGEMTLRVADGARGESPLLQLIDFSGELTQFPAAVAISARSTDRAQLTVYRGRLVLHGEGGQRVELGAGRSARIVRGHPVDLRAPFSGDMAPIEPIEGPAPEGAEVPPRPAAGLGRMTARVPGTKQVIGGVRLASHRVQVTVVDGLARTEVVEAFHNDTDRVLEGRFVFPLPPNASISRLALYVGKELVEGEMVERKRAARIFKDIVDDSVRPRDPALLEWVKGSEVSLKIFPIMPGKSRRVVLAYNQALPTEGGRVRYRYPLSAGSDSVTTIDDFAVDVVVRDSAAQPEDVMVPRYGASIATHAGEIAVSYGAESFAPSADFELSYRLASEPTQLRATFFRPGQEPRQELAERVAADDDASYVALRAVAGLAADAPLPAFVPRDRAFVVDGSHSQSPDSLSAATDAVEGLLRRMDPDERFVVLVCDAACRSYPTVGLQQARRANIEEAARWMSSQRNGGASDLAGALLAAGRRLQGADAGQLIYFGDGVVSAGELSAARIAERIGGELSGRGIDLRLLGVGRSVDEVLLRELAGTVGASYQALAPGGASAPDVDRLEMTLRAPVIERPQLTLPAHMEAAQTGPLPNMALGREWVALARLDKAADAEPSEVVLSGYLAGEPYRARYVLDVAEATRSNALVPRLWAERRIASLQHAREPAVVKQVVALSRQHHVMSRHTALLVLENEQMFRTYGVERTQRPSANKAPQGLLGIGGLGLRGIGMGGGGSDAPVASWGQQTGPGAGGEFDATGLGAMGQGASGQGTTGIGALGLGSGSGQGFGAGMGRMASRRTRAPRVRMGATSVSGRLPREVIRRVVRRSFGRFRWCYERGLQSNPTLSGRVNVNFVIGRTGRVSNVSATGDMPNSAVRSCVSRAFYGLSFPLPEGGIVTVRYPIVFSPFAGARRLSTSLGGTRRWGQSSGIRHATADDSFRSLGSNALKELEAKLLAQPSSRGAHINYLRGALTRGHFALALVAAKRFVQLDPDLAEGFELLAYAAAANGEGALAAEAMGSRVELAVTNAALQQQTARAYAAAGDVMRACAHWRAVAELRPSASGAKQKARECRARSALPVDSGRLDALAAAPQSKPGWLRAEIRCQPDTRCPQVLLLGPNGRIFSPWTPDVARSGAAEVGVTRWRAGTYRTLLIGSVPSGGAKLTLIAQDVARTVSLPADTRKELRTVAVTEVPQQSRRWW